MSTFPFLTADGFDRACQDFLRRVDAAGGAQDLGWLGVEYMTSEVCETAFTLGHVQLLDTAGTAESSCRGKRRINLN